MDKIDDIDKIIDKGKSGTKLSNKEIESLMLKALTYLKFINCETKVSIARLTSILESRK